MKEKGPIKVGIAGFGSMGTHHAEHYFKDSRKFELVVVEDIIPDRLKMAKEKYGTRTYSNFSKFLADEEVELVVIATPSNNHKAFVVKALKAGKHTIVEKPMCLNAAEAEVMIKTAKEAKKILSVFQNRRWDSDFRTVRSVVEKGLLGKIYQVKYLDWAYSDLMLTFGVKEFRPHWRSEKAYGGGVLYDFGAHFLDQLLQLIKSPVADVYGELQMRRWSKEVDDSYLALIRFKDGVAAHIEGSHSSLAKVRTGWLINGEKGGYEDGKVILRKGGKLKIKRVKPLKSNWSAYYNNIYRVLRNQAELIVKPEEVKKVMMVIDAIKSSSAKGKVVKLEGQ